MSFISSCCQHGLTYFFYRKTLPFSILWFSLLSIGSHGCQTSLLSSLEYSDPGTLNFQGVRNIGLKQNNSLWKIGQVIWLWVDESKYSHRRLSNVWKNLVKFPNIFIAQVFISMTIEHHVDQLWRQSLHQCVSIQLLIRDFITLHEQFTVRLVGIKTCTKSLHLSISHPIKYRLILFRQCLWGGRRFTG